MEDIDRIAEDLNTIGKFLAKRDINSLTSRELEIKYGINQADLLILFGGSIPYGCDMAGQAFIKGIAKNMMIVGGEGHTTDHLRKVVCDRYPEIDVKNRMESDIIYDYLNMKYGIKDCLLERNSTNCGNNVSYALEVVQAHKVAAKSIIIMQDSSMQQRMDATFRKVWKEQNCTIINYAAYIAKVEAQNGYLEFEKPNLWGMWNIEQYIALLLGEIPRLSDNENGYGPKGKNFIAHVDIPPEVSAAFHRLKVTHHQFIRKPFRLSEDH